MNNRTYTQHGDFTKQKNSQTRFIHFVSTDSTANIKSFTLLESPHDGGTTEIVIIFNNNDTNATAELSRLLEDHYTAFRAMRASEQLMAERALLYKKAYQERENFVCILPESLSQTLLVPYYDDSNTLKFRAGHTMLLKALIPYIHQYTPIDPENMKILMQAFESYKCKVIDTLIKSGLEAALNEANEYSARNPDVFYELGKYCQEAYPANLQMAVDCYQQVNEDNPFFKLSAKALLSLQLQDNPGNNSQDETITRLKSLLFAAGNTGEDKRLTAQLLHQLCGYNDVLPKREEAGFDYETVVSLADEIRSLRAELLNVSKRELENRQQHQMEKPTTTKNAKLFGNSLSSLSDDDKVSIRVKGRRR